MEGHLVPLPKRGTRVKYKKTKGLYRKFQESPPGRRPGRLGIGTRVRSGMEVRGKARPKLTESQYQRWLDDQQNQCAICGKEAPGKDVEA